MCCCSTTQRGPPEIGQVDWLHSVDAPKRLEAVTNGVPVRVHERRQAAPQAPALRAPRPSYHPKHVGVWAEWERDDYYGFHQAARPFDLTEIEEAVRRALGPLRPVGGFTNVDPTDPNGNPRLPTQAVPTDRGASDTVTPAKAGERQGSTSIFDPIPAHADIGQNGHIGEVNGTETGDFGRLSTAASAPVPLTCAESNPATTTKSERSRSTCGQRSACADSGTNGRVRSPRDLAVGCNGRVWSGIQRLTALATLPQACF